MEGNAGLRAQLLVPLDDYSTFLKPLFKCQKWPSNALFTPPNNMFLIEFHVLAWSDHRPSSLSSRSISELSKKVSSLMASAPVPRSDLLLLFSP